MKNFQTLKDKIKKALKEKIPQLNCTMCNHNNFIMVDGFLTHSVKKEISNSMIIGGPTIPTVGIICSNCGHLHEFSLGVLGLLEQEKNPNKKKNDSKKK